MGTQTEVKKDVTIKMVPTGLDLLLRKQPIMRKVLVSLIPIILFSIYLYGWRVLSIIAFTTICGVLTEYYFEKARGGKPSDSVLVTCFLYALTLPVTIPYWIAAVGIIFGVTFAKQVFGGFGRNVFNPALVARCFVFVTFPAFMTNNWAAPFSGFPGGIVHWAPRIVDGVTTATPLALAKTDQLLYSYRQLLIGNIPGSMGESSAILIILAGLYLIHKKTASWKTMLSVFTAFLIMEAVFSIFGGSHVSSPLAAVLSGGFLFGTVFMATDPVSSPTQDKAKVAYGILIGVVAAVIREFSLFPEGMMFAILIVNCFVPLMDIAAKSVKRRAAA